MPDHSPLAGIDFIPICQDFADKTATNKFGPNTCCTRYEPEWAAVKPSQPQKTLSDRRMQIICYAGSGFRNSACDLEATNVSKFGKGSKRVELGLEESVYS